MWIYLLAKIILLRKRKVLLNFVIRLYLNYYIIISKQIIRSATSIGANINEAGYGSSKADFIAKMHIALKECAETEYWIRLLKESEYITEDLFEGLINNCLSIKRMLVASLNTVKKDK